MRERKPGGVQELPLEPEVAGDAVDRVPRHRKPDRFQVDADLVRAAGLEADAQQRALAEQALHLEVRDRLARRGRVERVTHGVVPVTPDGGLDAAAARARL